MPTTVRFWIILFLIVLFLFFLFRKFIGRIFLVLLIFGIAFMIYRWIHPEGANQIFEQVKNLPTTVTNLFAPKDKTSDPIVDKLDKTELPSDIELEDTDFLPLEGDLPLKEGIEDGSIGIVASGSRTIDPLYLEDQEGNRYYIDPESEFGKELLQGQSGESKVEPSLPPQGVNDLSSQDLLEAKELFNL